MTDEILFRDSIPYLKDSNIEHKRHQRRSARRSVEELGATHVAVFESETNTSSYHVSGRVIDPRADIGRIQEVLRSRGGRSFSQITRR